MCVQLNMGERVFSRHPTMNFGLVGVFEDYGKKTTRRRMELHELSGKVFAHKGLLMSIPMNILCEK